MSAALQPLSMSARAEQVVPGEILMRARDGVAAEVVAREHGLGVSRRGYRNAFVVLRGAVGNERALAARLGSDPRVVYAEPNYLRQPHAVRSDLWAFYNPGGLTVRYTRGRNNGLPVTSYSSTADADEDAYEEGFAYPSPASAVVIGSIDTGVEFSHSEFGGVNLIAGCDWFNNSGSTCSDFTPYDEDGHGTHTTGTMVGNTVGLAAAAGVGNNVSVLVQRVCGPMGCPLSAIANAIPAEADHPGMVAMNLSLGREQPEHRGAGGHRIRGG